MPRSTITKRVAAVVDLGVLAADVGVGQAIVQSGSRPIVTTRSLSVTRSPDGSTSEPAPPPPPASRSRDVTVNRPGLRLLSTVIVTRTGPMKWKPSAAGVFASGLAQLVVQRLVDVGEAGVIFGAELEAEVVGHDPPALDVDAAIFVHLAQEPPAELDRTNAGMRTT